ncbi:MAG: AIPR family protein [Candidatus Dormibacteria bacterium]
MAVEITEFHEDLFQDIIATADAGSQYAEDAFFERCCEYVIDAGELEAADRVQYISPRGLRIDGYGGDPASAEGVLSLIVADFNASTEIATLTATEMDSIFKRAMNFLERSLDHGFRNSLEETSPAFGLVDLIAKRWPAILKVRLLLISNRVLSARVDGRPAGEQAGVPVTFSLWDLSRLHRFVCSGTGREDLLIELEKDFGGALPALPAHLSGTDYEAYLVVVPGSQLAAIYDRWGARLLEQNVRVFLQARGKVNKGIRNTIEHDPEMFFAYNNGITATAEAVEKRTTENGILLTGLRNLQIVNGGQTTASIHAAMRKQDVTLSKVFVQMKLSIVDPGRAIEIVPKISEYANTQNRVSAADFFSNHPFHIRMEEFSRRLFAPSPDGTFRESKWFYERARGQYQDERGRQSEAHRKRFDLEYPRTQVISKTDLAKYLNSWNGHPDTVSRGSQKNFADFAAAIGAEWDRSSDAFNEGFFRESVAKAIAFRETERLVSEQPWYQGGGIRSRVVPYAIAKLAHDAEKRGRYVDFGGIWRGQALSHHLISALTVASEAVHGIVVDAGPENPNPLEWAKQPACWSRVQALDMDWPSGWTEMLATAEERASDRRSAAKDQRLLNGIEAQTLVLKAGGPFWRAAREWGTERGILTPVEADILAVAASIPSRVPTEKQSTRAVGALRRLHAEGYQEGKGLL